MCCPKNGAIRRNFWVGVQLQFERKIHKSLPNLLKLILEKFCTLLFCNKKQKWLAFDDSDEKFVFLMFEAKVTLKVCPSIMCNIHVRKVSTKHYFHEGKLQKTFGTRQHFDQCWAVLFVHEIVSCPWRIQDSFKRLHITIKGH